MGKKIVNTILTPEFVVSWPVLYKAEDYKGDGKFKYSITMLFKKDAMLQNLIDLANKTVAAHWPAGIPDYYDAPMTANWYDPDKAGRCNAYIQYPQQAEVKDYDGYKDVIIVKASRSVKVSPPKVVENDAERTSILVESEIYAGCIAIASLTAYSYDPSPKIRGVRFGLNSVIKMNDGEPLSGGESAESAFENVPLPAGSPAGAGGSGASVLDL